MLYQIKILLFIILFGCGSSDNQTRNRSTSQKDISYYNLQYYSHIDDNGTQIDIAIPKELQKSDVTKNSNDPRFNKIVIHYIHFGSTLA